LDRCPRVYTSPSLTGVRAAARFDREGAEAIVESSVAALSHSAATSLESRPAESAKHKLPLTPYICDAFWGGDERLYRFSGS
jgi:N-ethylmaleimide reductase